MGRGRPRRCGVRHRPWRRPCAGRSGGAHRVVVGEHEQRGRLDARQLVGGQGELGTVASQPDEPVEHGEEGVLEVVEALGGEDELGDLGREWVLVDHLGQLLDLALRRRLELHHQPAEGGPTAGASAREQRCRTRWPGIRCEPGRRPGRAVDRQPARPQGAERVGDHDRSVQAQSVEHLGEESHRVGPQVVGETQGWCRSTRTRAGRLRTA